MGTTSGQQLLELAHRLDQFGQQFERFLDDQLAGLEQAVVAVPAASATSDDQVRRELEVARRTWDQEHREQIRGLEQEREALASAWLRIETEQREILTQRQAARLVSAGAPTAPAAARDAEEGARSGRTSAPTLTVVGTSGPAPDAAIRQAVLRQFQQLRSDVRRCAQQRAR